MNAKILFKAAVLCMAMLAGSITFSSCSEDEEDPIEEETNKLTDVNVKYSINLSENWFKYFDIEVSYNTGVEEKTITITEGLSYNVTVPYTGEEVNYYCNVTAKPKAEVPAFNTDTAYYFAEEIQVVVSGKMEDGTVASDFGLSGAVASGSINIAGAAMEAYTHKEHKLYTFSYTPEK